MISSRYNRAFLIIAASATVMLIPTAAHASALDWGASLFGLDLHDSMGTAFIKVFVGLLQTIQNSLISGIAYLSKALSWAIGLRPDGGGPVIYGAWKVFRDLCNLAFIVVIIMSSFATVFKTFEFGWLKPYAMPNKTLIFGFLAAAIFINFSLAIGQSIVAISNYVTGMMIEILPNDVGGQIGLRLNAVAALAGKAPAVIVDPAKERPITNPSVLQDSATLKQKANSKWETMMLGSYLNCLNISGFWVNNQKCYEDAVHQGGLLPYPDVATANQRQYSTASGNPPSVREVGGFLQVLSGNGDFVLESDYQRLALESVAIRPITDVADDAAKIPSIMYSIFLYLVIALSFLVVIVFSLIRIPILWLILAFSPIAWIGLIFPGTDWWKKWWKEFMAWNLFSPMYLFIIYIGLYLLGQQNALLASLGTNGSPVDAQVGALLFYVMVGMIFIGGSAGVLSFARTGGTVAGGVIGGIQGSLGIKGTYGAAGAIYRGSGLEPMVSGAQKGVASVYERRVTAPLRRGREETEALYQARFGDRGALEALQRKRIKEQAEKNKERGLATSDLKKDFGAGPSAGPKYFAAADTLLGEGKLNAAEMLAYQQAASRISPSFSNAVREKVEKKLKDTGKEKQFKYKDTKEVMAALEQYQQDPKKPKDEAKEKMYNDILKKVEQTQPLLAAELASNGLYINPNGTRKTSEQIIEGGFKGMDNKDILTLLDESKKGKLQMTQAMETMLADRTKKLENYLSLANSATPEQQADIAHIAAIREQIQRKKNRKKKP